MAVSRSAAGSASPPRGRRAPLRPAHARSRSLHGRPEHQGQGQGSAIGRSRGADARHERALAPDRRAWRVASADRVLDHARYERSVHAADIAGRSASAAPADPSRSDAPASTGPPATIEAMTDEPTGDPPARPKPDPRFAWHPEPELIGIRDGAVSRPALERLGRRGLGHRARLHLRRGVPAGDGRAGRVRRAPADRSSAAAARATATDRAGPPPPPRTPARRPTVLARVHRAPRPVPAQRLSPALAELLHPAAAGDERRRRAARPGHPAGRRRLARRPVGRVRRGGGHPLADRPRRLPHPTVRAPTHPTVRPSRAAAPSGSSPPAG